MIFLKSVALVLDGLDIGGIERVGADYAKLFKDLGYMVTIVNLNPSKNKMEEKFPSECNFINFFFSRRESPEQYAQLIKKNCWGRFIYPLVYIILKIWIILKKVYFRLKFGKNKYSLVISFSSHFNDLTFVSENFLQANQRMSWVHGAIYSYLLISDGYINLYQKIHNLVVLVDDAQEEFFMYNKQLDLNVNKLYNPTYFSKIERKNIDLRKKYGDYILMVARFDYPHKDHYTVIRAFRDYILSADKKLNLVLVGDGPDLEKVKDFTSTLENEVKKRIFFAGSTTNVEDYYKNAKLLVHASVAGEGLPTVILETLAQSIPVVSTDSKVGPREILGNNEYGLLSKVKDYKDMSNKIRLLLEDEKLYEKYKKLGEKRANDFRPNVIREKLNKILGEID